VKHNPLSVATRFLSQGPRQNKLVSTTKTDPTTRPYVLRPAPTPKPDEGTLSNVHDGCPFVKPMCSKVCGAWPTRARARRATGCRLAGYGTERPGGAGHPGRGEPRPGPVAGGAPLDGSSSLYGEEAWIGAEVEAHARG
jgi:hypothetical protein